MGGRQSKAAEQLRNQLVRAVESGDLTQLRDGLSRIANAQAGLLGNGREVDALRSIDLNAPANGHFTLLQLAVRAGHPETVRQLLEIGVEPNRANEHTLTPLHYACEKQAAMRPGCGQVIGVLLRGKADACLASNDGFTPLDLARDCRSSAAVKVLEDALAVWSGHVDFWETSLIPKWASKYLVVHLDRRPNTGRNAQNATRLQCPNCNSFPTPPPHASQFPCSGCHTPIMVCPSLQIVIHDDSATWKSSSLVVPLPAFKELVSVRRVEEASRESAKGLLLRGSVRRAFQSVQESERKNGLLCKILQPGGKVTRELSFRVSTETELVQLETVLQDPSLASYQASLAGLSSGSTRGSMPIQEFVSSEPTGASVTLQLPFSQGSSISVSAPPIFRGGSLDANVNPAPCPPTSAPPPSMPTPSAPPMPSAPPAENDQVPESSQCAVCMDRPSDSAVVPCGHMCGCHVCLEQVRVSALPHCPICRGPVTAVIRIYR